jgi:hypothetical protein
MVRLAITGKADKRIITYPLMRACSIAGRTCVITDDVAYKRLYAGNENYGEVEDIKIYILPTMDIERIKEFEDQEIEDEIEYIIYISDSYYPVDANRILMLCEHNNTFLGNYIEDILYDHSNVTFGTLTLNPRKKILIPKEVHMHQIGWKPEYSLYLFQIEELRQLLPLKDKAISALLIDSFTSPLNIKPTSFADLLKRKRYSYTKKDKGKEF